MSRMGLPVIIGHFIWFPLFEKFQVSVFFRFKELENFTDFQIHVIGQIWPVADKPSGRGKWSGRAARMCW